MGSPVSYALRDQSSVRNGRLAKRTHLACRGELTANPSGVHLDDAGTKKVTTLSLTKNATVIAEFGPTSMDAPGHRRRVKAEVSARGSDNHIERPVKRRRFSAGSGFESLMAHKLPGHTHTPCLTVAYGHTNPTPYRARRLTRNPSAHHASGLGRAHQGLTSWP